MAPLIHVAAAIDQDQNHNSGRKATLRRAASVPAISRRENPRLESLRSRKQSSFWDVKDIPSSSFPTSVAGEGEGYPPTQLTIAARGRKRGPSPRGTPQTDPIASTSASVAELIPDGEQRPRKRRRRSPVPSAAASSSQFSAPSQSRRRTRSRVGSPVTDVEYVQPSRISARLKRRTHPVINYRSPDIYTHLADPDSAGHLLSESSTSSLMLSTSKDCSQSVGKPRGRRKKTIDLGDEVTKKNLMEEWAQLRQSQGALPLSGIDQNACPSKILFRDTQNGSASVSSLQLQPTTQGNLPDPGLVENQTTTVAGISQSGETVVSLPPSNSSLVPMDLGNGLPAVPNASENHNGSVRPGGETDQPTIPGKGVEASSIPVTDLRVDEDFPNAKSTGAPDLAYHHEMLQLHGSSPPAPSTLVSRDGPVYVRHNEQAKASGINDAPKDSHSMNMSQMSSLDSGTVQHDFEEEFYMLDIPEMFTLPWVPVSSHLYVPPGLGKLISGMREQLAMATRARRRAEELYQAELSRRISAERVVEELQTRLEERQDAFAAKATCLKRQRASSAPYQPDSDSCCPPTPQAAVDTLTIPSQESH